MKAPSSLALGALLAASVALVGCADHNPLTPLAPRADVALEEGTDAGPDSGEVVIEAIPEGGGSGFRTLSLAALPAARDIRIGVVPSGPMTLSLGGAASYTITDKASGVALMSGTAGAVTVTLTGAPPSYYRLQVSCLNAATTATKLAAAQAAGYVTFTEYVPAAKCTRLYLGQFATNASFAVRNNFRNTAIAGGFAANDSFWKIVSVASGTATYTVTRGASLVTTVNPVIITSSDGIVTINGVRYRGKGEARMNGTGTLAGINELPLEQYLYGVVPRELPPTSLWGHPEAQKTQAVAARTYAMRGYGKRASDGYDLLATTSDQVYGGYDAEQAVSNAAVDATAGVVATYDGALIDALFSSTAGGHTANSEEAFSSELPYLRGVPDRDLDGQWDNQADKTLEKFLKDDKPKLLLKEQKGDYEAGFSSYYRWTYEWTMDEMSGLISALAGQPVGRVLEVNVTKRGPSGRALEVQYVTEAGTFTSGKDGSTRAALKYRNAAGNIVSLPSTRIFIEPTYESGKSGPVTGYRVYGAGFGHGVGMSQTGAAGMAAAGYTYDQILKHYYTGIELTAPVVSAVP